MKFRASWVLLVASLAESLGGLYWSLRNDLKGSALLAICSAAHVAYYLIVEHKDDWCEIPPSRFLGK